MKLATSLISTAWRASEWPAARGENGGADLGPLRRTGAHQALQCLGEPREKMLYSAEALEAVFHQPCEHTGIRRKPMDRYRRLQLFLERPGPG